MPFVFDETKLNAECKRVVVDAERGITLVILRSYFGRHGGRIGGLLVGLSWPSKMGEEKAIAHLYVDEVFPDPNHVNLHWELATVHIPEVVLAYEHDIITVMEEAIRVYPSTNNPDVVKDVTTDFGNYSISPLKIGRA